MTLLAFYWRSSATRVGAPTAANLVLASATHWSKRSWLTTSTVDRHEGVARAAQFGALAVEHAFAVGLEPGLVDPAGHGVDLHAEGGDRPGVDDVGAGGDDPHGLVDRHDDVVVGAEQPRLALLRRVAVGQHQRIEGEIAVVGIFVGPEPLLADGLDGDVGLRNDVLDNRAAGTTGSRSRPGSRPG